MFFSAGWQVQVHHLGWSGRSAHDGGREEGKGKGEEEEEAWSGSREKEREKERGACNECSGCV